MDHNLVVKEKPSNFEQYRWEATCSCGWQGRGPSEVVATSMGVSHGGKLPEKKAPTEVPKEETPKDKVATTVTKPKS